jgi:peptide/nickel transport system permease protein
MSAPSLPTSGPIDLASRSSWTVGSWLGATGLIVAGIVLVFLGTAVLDRVTVWPRWVLALIGLWLTWRGVDALCKARWGQEFQTALWLAGMWVGGLVLVSLLVGVLPLQKPGALPLQTATNLRPDLFSAHPLGTDSLGRDILSRVVYGARIALVVGVGSTAIGLTIGTVIGMLAGYWRGRSEAVIDIVADSLLAFPALVFLLGLVVVLRPRLSTLFIAFTILIVPTVIRLAKANTYAFANREFVRAARSLGASHRRILFRELLPNVIPSLLSFSMVIVASVIIGEATLSFLGLGIQPPTPSWGNMIADAETNLQQYPHTLLAPAAALFFSVMAFNRLGESARRATRESVLL